MKTEVKKLGQGQVELTIEVSVLESEPYIDRAAKRLAQKTSVPGFRPGKAPLELLRSRFGAMAIYEEALQELVSYTLFQALKEQAIASVGKPTIAVEKVAPGNPIVFKATVAVMPTITLNNWRAISVQKKTILVSEADVDKLIDDVRNMQAQEILVEREARKEDKVALNFEVRVGGAIIEGGKGVKQPIVIGSKVMIPGFEEQIIGLKAGAKKEFKLTFPKPYFQSNLEGKEANFSVEVVAVYERILPKKNDEWAMRAINKPYKEFREGLRQNLVQEKEMKEQRRIEQEIVEKIVAQSTFTDIPEPMTSAEVQKMLIELEEDINERGLKWEQYLSSLKKTQEELGKDFLPHAELRVKAALVLRELAKELKVETAKEEIEAEIKRQKEVYAGNAEIVHNLEHGEYRQYLAITLTNRKVIEKLFEVLVH